MINIIDKSKCCGCGACIQRCPKHCIAMIEDEEGFLYPKVYVLSCINCGACETVCPVINQNESKRPLFVLASKNRDKQKRLQSSSGGQFIALAEQIINQGGVVFGALFDKDWTVKHTYTDNLEELQFLMRSKYVQSNIGSSYKEAETFLKNGTKVMFVGTSCQISGLKKYLRKEYENLLAVDIVCHGVPSPGIWKRYLEKFDLRSITEINFRSKHNEGFEWKQYGLTIKGYGNRILYSKWFQEDLYMKGFLANLFLRPSCALCPAKDGRCGSDLTLADFWGIESIIPEFSDSYGISSVFVHSLRGKKYIEQLKIDTKVVTYDQAVAWNESYYCSTVFNRQREKFWILYNKTGKLDESIMKALYVSPIKKKCNYMIGLAYYNIHRLVRIVKRLIRK